MTSRAQICQDRWAETIQPSLEILFRAPAVIDAESRASSIPRLTATQYAGAYEGVFIMCTTVDARVRGIHRSLVYQNLDNYLVGICKDVVAAISAENEGSPVTTYLTAYNRYISAAHVTSRLFAYMDRHFVGRERWEGWGWIVVEGEHKSQQQLESKVLHKRSRDLRKYWGLSQGYTKRQEEEAELRAEIASAADRIVSSKAMALRRWRLDVVLPFLKTGEHSASERPYFLRAIDSLIAGMNDASIRRNLLEGLATSFASVGLPEDDCMRKKLVEALA